MEVIGRIKVIGQPQDISSSFRKREVVVTTEEQYPQDILIEFTQDRVNLLDSFQVGEPVKVSINLRGREWTSPQGEVRYFNTIQGWRIERNMPAQGMGQPMGQPMQNQYTQQPTMGQPAQQAGGFNQNYQGNQGTPNQFAQQAPQAPQTSQFPPAPSFTEEDHDDLPF
ncbi:DUF3127 domain-containing protein [Myroides sp. WP-1]|uniref:DUF3127 domain-containing protein n=1 Tax=Myroides sp. WP-1 TaxID=2759944 RepID=UPI0015FBA3A6|nr:DUF3127 domain-containing protein [Myroides sp. WP-1]MBB1138788.1 DUF3127 domain-containing protein [Myroides sp. WP-1]